MEEIIYFRKDVRARIFLSFFLSFFLFAKTNNFIFFLNENLSDSHYNNKALNIYIYIYI